MRPWCVTEGIQVATSCDFEQQCTALDSNRYGQVCSLDDNLSQSTQRKQVKRWGVVETTRE